MIDQEMLMESLEMFRLDRNTWIAVADHFKQELEWAEAGKKSSLRILPSYLSAPSGQEKGNYVAIDFGGSNLRVMHLQLEGSGTYRIIKQLSRPLQDSQGKYDYTGPHTSGREIFGFVADLVAEVVLGVSADGLGFTFSYPMEQDSIDSASLIRWTKELNPAHTIGQDVGIMLSDALISRGIKMKPRAIINDAVAVFLAGSYHDSRVCAGSICGTGFNTCIMTEGYDPQGPYPMVVNTEAGNFSRLPANCYDRLLDNQTEDPGQQIMEKMVSGKYLGELLRVTLRNMGERGAWSDYDPSLKIWNQPFALKTEVMDWLQNDHSSARSLLKGWMAENGIPIRVENYQLFSRLAKAIVERAIMVIAATYYAALQRTRPLYSQGQVIAVDGALFKHWPGFLQEIEKILQRELPDRSIFLSYTVDGSAIGAAIAAALA